MTNQIKKNLRMRSLIFSLVFSFVLMIFPVASGVIVVTCDIEALRGYWIQGFFVMLSIVVPIIYLLITKKKPYQIGLTGVEKGSYKTLLYFIPIIVAKIGFLIEGINNDIHTIVALAFFTIAIGLSEEIYFRGIILKKLMTCFTIKTAVLLSSLFFASVHASQAFSGAGYIMVTLTIVNALIFGIVASEIAIISKSIIPVIIWHVLYDYINWITLNKGLTEIILIVIQSVIVTFYAGYLWFRLPDGNSSICNNLISGEKKK